MKLSRLCFLPILLLFVAGCVTSTQRSIARGAAWLIQQQQPDGSWRSGTHGVFRDGSALTPHVLRTLALIDEGHPAVERGRAFVEKLNPHTLAYPAYAAADASYLLPPQKWIELLRSRQVTSREAFPNTGGWAYASGGIDPAAEANISVTASAVCAMADAGVPPGDPAMQMALEFVLRCRTADGGFCFGATDTVDSKAGVGIAYGSATADGLRAMLACGLPRNDPRVVQTIGWLKIRFDPSKVAGDFTAAREPMRNANYHYYLAALTDAFTRAGVTEHEWAGAIAKELSARQRPDGSWQNPISAGREDDATVATAFALRALRLCK